ncbi:hypothetical protein BJX61DRAFT_274704 [Aspergillus egyptiacus]|nr:hypothetical protein BJX61DRAFT_274704 [Aspergillus egyptiacus]
MALSVTANLAEEVAAGFRPFREPLPEHATEITGLIADLFAISTSLKALEDLSQHREYRSVFHVARSDVELVKASLHYTLDDVVDFFGDLDRRRGSRRSAHKRIWDNMCSFFSDESGDSLAIRLAKYKSFLKELEDLIKDARPDLLYMSRLREAFKELLAQQDARLAMRLGAMSVTSASSSSSSGTAPSTPVSERKPRTKRSYERPRPPHLSPQSPTSPSSGSFDIPPLAPEAPGSPIRSSVTSQSLGSNSLSEHWATQVFSKPRTATRLPNRNDTSECYGDAQPGLTNWLHKEGFEELLHLPRAFPSFAGSPDFQVYFYVREDDHRARVVCKATNRTGPTDYFCLPLNMLECFRYDTSCLQLCRRRRSGTEFVVWANLKFSTIEDMVLFHCTFLALRSQDSGRPVTTAQIRDYELDEEEELHGSPIVDDGFLHALRVYRDRATGSIRLQASIHKGEKKRTPVWTAFITDQIRSKSKGWVRLVEPKVVLLRELRQTIFTFPEYTPPKTQRGGHVLHFMNRTDAEGFVDTMFELAAGVL